MLHVACVRWGEAFGVEYVERLHDMVRRNLPDGFAGRFVCFTDRPADLSHLAGVETYPLTVHQGWWAKLELFKADAFPAGDRVWYFDLDTVITGPLDRLFEYPGAFGLLEDVYRPGGFQSSVMSWIAGTQLSVSIWDEWTARGCPLPHGGDQTVLEYHWHGEPGHEVGWLHERIGGAPWPPDFLQSLYPGVLRSYKVDCVWQIPKGTSVVFFHGLPRPHEVLTGWVPEVWKVGGGSSAELVVVGTIAQEQVLKNVTDALKHGYDTLTAMEPNDQTALICGGSPSLKEQLMLISNMQRGGAVIFSCNNADGFLREHGITANFHVMLDARPELAEWVHEGGLKLYASMCDPTTLEIGHVAGQLVLWHALTDGIDRIVGKAMLVGGGTTVGTRAMALAYVMGFRKILCFGMDSCYAKDQHHAYGQALNDGERVLDCVVGGQRFKAAPWMVQQAEDWKELTLQLSALGCEVSVFGSGMLAAIGAGMNSATVEIDGILWPSRDTETRSSVLATVSDLQHYIGLCEHKRIAIQAGGNVGVWPKELAKHFALVHTFEPDSLNYECLARNVRETNVIAHAAALGEAAGVGAIARDPHNCGASAVAAGNEFPIITVDSLGLDHVDLLQLDVEGFELQVLKGAAETIARSSPLIVLELKGLGERYGYTDKDVDDLMRGHGYQRIGVAHRDVIYKRTSNG